MKFAFVSTMAAVPWGGSEVLWSSAAQCLSLLGHDVYVSVPKWPRRAEPVQRLAVEFGISIREHNVFPTRTRPLVSDFFHGLSRPFRNETNLSWLRRVAPDLLCISSGNAIEGIGWMQLAYNAQIPFVSIVQAHAEFLWPTDVEAERFRQVFAAARRCFFVSRANLSLVETQLAQPFENAEVIFNPANVDRRVCHEWPFYEDGVWRIACVGRLHPPSKGQDLLLAVLRLPEWLDRPIHVSFFGEGPHEQMLRRLVQNYGLQEKVSFRGHVSDVAQIWRENHALVLPSRYEGLPLAVVEALLCGRPVIVTDVAGNAEVVEDGVTGFVAESPKVIHLACALERAWSVRDQWHEMGKRAQISINQVVPEDAGAIFANMLISLM